MVNSIEPNLTVWAPQFQPWPGRRAKAHGTTTPWNIPG